MGHITPLLSIYSKLKNDYEIIYFGLKDSMEEEACKRLDIQFFPMNVLPFNRKNLLKNYHTYKCMKNEIKRIKSDFKNAPIKAIISSGGYVSFPLVFSFKNNKKVKKILLEPNSVIGLANKVLSFKVDYICTQFDISKNAKFITTGNPIKINNPIFDHPSFYKNSNMILFVGGSNGALEIVKLAYDFNYNFPDVEIFVITGNRYFETYKFNSSAHVYKRINDISSIFKFFKIIVSRSGASTITEIVMTKSASVLLPSKNVTANHQYKNAKYLENLNACVMIIDYKKDSYLEVYNLFKNDDLILSIKGNIEKFNKINPLENVIKLI